MNAHTRRAVAYIAGSVAVGATSGTLYDHETGRDYEYPGEVSRDLVSVHDRDQGCEVGGIPPSLYHHGHGNHLRLDVTADSFTGFDYGSGFHFSGRVVGSEVQLFDEQTDRDYRFDV